MNIVEYRDIGAAWQQCEAALSIDPGNNTQLLSTVNRARKTGLAVNERIHVATRDQRVCGVAIRVAMNTVFLSTADDEAIAALGRHMRKTDPSLSSAVGRRDVVERFTIAYLRGSARAPKVHARLMLYRLADTFRNNPNYGRARGSARLATLDDLALCVEWQNAFNAEARTVKSATPVEPRVRALIELSQITLWESAFGEVVSLAVGVVLPANSACIAMVYTPPSQRNLGYAQAVTAAVSSQMQFSGSRAVFLFADTTNEASNKSYQRVGYEHIADHLHLTFETTPSAFTQPREPKAKR